MRFLRTGSIGSGDISTTRDVGREADRLPDREWFIILLQNKQGLRLALTA